MERRVVCAALRNRHGDIICSARHYDSIMLKHVAGSPAWRERATVEQGFIDQRDIFMTREEAYTVALAACQIIRHCGGDDGVLFSENLY